MWQQMDIFDFIGGRPGNMREAMSKQREGTLLARLFGRVDNPAVNCVNCLCSYCANNAEELYRHVMPGEQREACFNCDGCREYSGSPSDKGKMMEGCGKFLISDYGAKKARKKFHVVGDA